MNSNFLFKNRFKEENDFFLSYINDRLKDVEYQLSSLSLEEGKFDQYTFLNKKIILINNKTELEHMKEHYYTALNHGRFKGAPKKPKKENNGLLNKEKEKDREMQNFEDLRKSPVSSVLNLIHVAKAIKYLKTQDEFLTFIFSNNITFDELTEISNFYKSCFSQSNNKSFPTNSAKLQFSQNMLEIYCNEMHPLHSHFQAMRLKIETIAKSSTFLSRPPLNKKRTKSSQNLNKSLNKSDIFSGSQSDDTRRVLKKNFLRNKTNIENYDGDSEKSFTKENEEVKEENEEEFMEDRPKSDGEKQACCMKNLDFMNSISRPKFKNLSHSRQKPNKLKKNKKLKKMYDSGDHATGGSASERYQDSRNKLFTWGIRGLQKFNNNPPKGFDTDKDMKL